MTDLTKILNDKGFICWGTCGKDADKMNEQTTQAIKNNYDFVWIPGILLDKCPDGIPNLNKTNYKDEYFLYLKR